MQAYAKHKSSADAAYRTFVALCGDAPVRVPGCDTAIRLAVRIEVGHSIEVAAAREYLYRWRLALQSPIFGAPHALGT